jgi:regulator of protease activity HflC (stomatin/prohibitin superfamily)
MMRQSRNILGLIMAALIVSGCAQVQGDEVGVRSFNIYFGVEKKAKQTGTYLYIPVLFDFYFFPKTQQKLEMVESEIAPASTLEMEKKTLAPAQQSMELQLERVENQMAQLQQLKVVPHKLAEGRQNIRVKTADGNDIWTDVTVTYQVIEDKAPVVVQKVGVSMNEVERLVGMETRGVIRQVMGELGTRDFYQSEMREAKIVAAQKLLNDKLNPLGVNINSLAINQFRFLPEYEDLLRERALADQKKQEYEQLTLAAQKEKEAKVAKAKGDADAMRALAEGRRESLKIQGAAEQYSREQEAFAAEVRLTKEAEGLRELVKGLGGPGGDALVAREVARTLEGKKLILVPGEGGAINLTNVNELLKTYGGIKLIEKESAPEKKK